MSQHRYPLTLVFRGAYEDVSSWRMAFRLFIIVLRSQADLVVLPGYHRIEYWAQLAAAILRGLRRGVFCDSTAFDNRPTLPQRVAKIIFFWACHGYFCY